MDPHTPGPLRIYHGDPPPAGPADAHRLAARELLRPAPVRRPGRELEPFSRGWFEELELKRYSPPGGWIRRSLEFTRHAGESLVVLGPGVGTDALQYQRHGVHVTVCARVADRPDLLKRNFDLRGVPVRVAAAGADGGLPFDRGTFDLAYLNLLYDPPADIGRAAAEAYRVLKPGGKVFALAPARFDAGFWQDVVLPFRRWYRPRADLTDAPRYSAVGLRRAFGPFADARVGKRHLRRSELPYLWRLLPAGVLERAIGRVLVLRAFKPVAAALEADAVDPAA